MTVVKRCREEYVLLQREVRDTAAFARRTRAVVVPTQALFGSRPPRGRAKTYPSAVNMDMLSHHQPK